MSKLRPETGGGSAKPFRVLAAYLALLALLLAGCSPRQPDKSVIEIGADRETVQKELWDPYECDEFYGGTTGCAYDIITSCGLYGCSSASVIVVYDKNEQVIEHLGTFPRRFAPPRVPPQNKRSTVLAWSKKVYENRERLKVEYMEDFENSAKDFQYYRAAQSTLKDPTEQWWFYCLAAHRRHAISQFKLGDSYRRGTKPVTQDFVKAYTWHRLAEIGGMSPEVGDASRPLRPWRSTLVGKMTADEIAEAESRALTWQPNPAECETIATKALN